MSVIRKLRLMLTQARYSKDKMAIQKTKSINLKIPEKNEVKTVGQHIIEGLQEAIEFANSAACGARVTVVPRPASPTRGLARSPKSDVRRKDNKTSKGEPSTCEKQFASFATPKPQTNQT